MENRASTPILLHKHSVISCAIAKGGALRERRNVRTSGGSISLVGNGIAYNNWLYAPLSVLIGYPPKITATRTAIVPAMPIITLFRFLTFCRRAALSS